MASARDEDALFRAVLRLADVVVEAIRQNPTLGGAVLVAQATDINFSPAFDARAEFVRAATVRVRLRANV